MARIPDAPDLAPVDAPAPSTASITPTDFGLGAAGQELDQVGEYQRRAQISQIKAQATADRKSVEPQVLKLVNDNADAFVTDAGQWTGTPGFAQDQIGKARSRAQAVAEANPGWTPGQKSEFRFAADQVVQQYGLKAIDHEAQVLQQHQADALDVQGNGALANFQAAYAPQAQTLKDNYDGSQTGLTQSALTAFDTAAKTAVASAPAQVQPRLQAQLSAMRVEEAAKFGALEAHGADALVYKNALDQASGLINTISSNPTAYDSVVDNNLPAIVSTMAPGLRKDALHDLTAQAAQARVRGLIQTNNPAQAQAELNDGRYDAFLKPPEKEQLLASADAAARDKAPKSLDQALAQQDVLARAEAETRSRVATGQSTGVSAADLQSLPFERQAEILSGWKRADQVFAAAGAVRDMPLPQVIALASAAPGADAASQAQQLVAQQEMKARLDDPAMWAMAPRFGKGAAGAASGLGQDRGAALQALWQQAQTLQGPDQAQAAARFATTQLQAQQQAGIPAEARRLLPKDEAARLANLYVQAEPSQKLAAVRQIAAIAAAMPTQVSLADGSRASPQALLAQELRKGGLDPQVVAAIGDFGDPAHQAALSRTVMAINDTAAPKSLSDNDRKRLAVDVRSNLASYLNTTAPLPGAQDMDQARIARTTSVATWLMATQHMNAGDAAKLAAQDLTGDFRYVDNYRVPAQIGDSKVIVHVGLNGVTSAVMTGTQAIRAGAARTLMAATANDGGALFAPATNPGTPDLQRKLYARQVEATGRWVTNQDDSGLTLALPSKGGGFAAVQDRYGRNITASWGELQTAAGGASPPPSFAKPPPPAQVGLGGQPAPAFSKQAAMTALGWAVNRQESSFRANVPNSPKGAMGQMQVTPATVQTYAPRLGLPVDLDRAQHDDAYNRQIGNAALADHVNHYGASAAGVVMALAAYNAGRGKVDGYSDQAGYHPGYVQQFGDPRAGHVSLDAWVDRLPAETRNYVHQVIPAALGKLQGHAPKAVG